MELDKYLDLAITRHGLKSDRELSSRLGFAGGTQVWRYRRKGDYPTPSAMVRLSELCGLDPKEGLLDLQMWKESDDGTLEVLARMKEIIRSAQHAAAIALVFFGGLSFSMIEPAAARAGTIMERSAADSRPVYIMGNTINPRDRAPAVCLTG